MLNFALFYSAVTEFNPDTSDELFIAVLVINGLYLIFEISKIVAFGLSYIFAPGNFVELVRIFLIFTLYFGSNELERIQKIGIIAATLCLFYLKLLGFLSWIPKVRYFIQSIWIILYDIQTFLFVLAFGILMYANFIQYFRFSIRSYETDSLTYNGKYAASLWYDIGNAYLLTQGDFSAMVDPETFNVDKDLDTLYFLGFCVFSFFMGLLLMKLLVAIMSSSISRVYANARSS